MMFMGHKRKPMKFTKPMNLLIEEFILLYILFFMKEKAQIGNIPMVKLTVSL